MPRYLRVRLDRPCARGHVYVVTHPAFDGVVKVGRAADPGERLTSYQTGCPERRYLMPYAVEVEDAAKVEEAVHRALAARRLCGEWFRCSVEEAVRAIEGARAA